MIEGWTVILLALGYVSGLFALAWYADRTFGSRKGGNGRPVIYALSLAVYCTSWTFFGSVGLAASTGYNFIPVYLGPILLFVFGWRFLQRIVRLAKSQNITSVADFLAARYGKSQAVGALVTVIAVAGTLPYIALQLKAVALSVSALLGALPLQIFGIPIDTAFVIAVLMAVWALLSGLLRLPARLRTARIARKTRRGRDAIAKGLIAIGAGDPDAARRHADIAARNASHGDGGGQRHAALGLAGTVHRGAAQ